MKVFIILFALGCAILAGSCQTQVMVSHAYLEPLDILSFQEVVNHEEEEIVSFTDSRYENGELVLYSLIYDLKLGYHTKAARIHLKSGAVDYHPFEVKHMHVKRYLSAVAALNHDSLLVNFASGGDSCFAIYSFSHNKFIKFLSIDEKIYKKSHGIYNRSAVAHAGSLTGFTLSCNHYYPVGGHLDLNTGSATLYSNCLTEIDDAYYPSGATFNYILSMDDSTVVYRRPYTYKHTVYNYRTRQIVDNQYVRSVLIGRDTMHPAEKKTMAINQVPGQGFLLEGFVSVGKDRYYLPHELPYSGLYNPEHVQEGFIITDKHFVIKGEGVLPDSLFYRPAAMEGDTIYFAIINPRYHYMRLLKAKISYREVELSELQKLVRKDPEGTYGKGWQAYVKEFPALQQKPDKGVIVVPLTNNCIGCVDFGLSLYAQNRALLEKNNVWLVMAGDKKAIDYKLNMVSLSDCPNVVYDTMGIYQSYMPVDTDSPSLLLYEKGKFVREVRISAEDYQKAVGELRKFVRKRGNS